MYILDLDARPWDFQGEECTLRTCVDRFNNRRYLSGGPQMMRNLTSIGTAAMANSNNGGGPVINDLNDYDQNLLDVNVNNAFQADKLNYTRGYGGWDEGIELSEEFKQQYEVWLQQEVFNHEINWDSLIESNHF